MERYQLSRPNASAGTRGITCALLLSLFVACSSSRPGPEPPARREIVGRLLDNDHHPIRDVFVLVDWSSSAQTDADGRFSIRDVAPGSYSLHFMKGEVSLRGTPLNALRPLARPGGAVVQSEIAITVKRAVGPLDVGTWLAEDYTGYRQRVSTTFGPYCDKAFAGETLAAPQDALPLTLEWDAESEWHWRYSETLASLPTARVATICLRQKKTEVGRYGGPFLGPKAYDYAWDIVVVSRDGRLLRKSFSEGPPLTAKVTRGVAALALTDQEEKLKIQVGQWLREGLGETRPPP